MTFMILPLVAVLFFAGLAAQAAGFAQAVPGAGVAGRMQSAAIVSGHRAEVFAGACVEAALEAPGVIAATLPVPLPAGVIAPAGAGCITTAGATGGRNVYAVVPAVPGAAGQVMSDTQGSAAWLRVEEAGLAFDLVTGLAVDVPASLTPGALLAWTLVEP
ncbi:hypothetical protein LJR034_001520 [Caballeronia sp. LjRoot34]|uniref:hypothetical protein n=1 Tax=Caballeronia sp. LjRoot34 TaxID=3342325 RepID=UPI003ECC7C28